MVDEAYLARIRELPCCVCGRSGPSDAAHIRMSGAGWGYPDKSYTGGGERPDDCWAVPLCRPIYKPDPVARIIKPDKPVKLVFVGCHGVQHGHDRKKLLDLTAQTDEQRVKLEEAFWRSTGKNPFMIATTLYEKFGTTLRPRRKKRWKADKQPRPKKAPTQKRKIANRGFDKTKRRKLNGKVERKD